MKLCSVCFSSYGEEYDNLRKNGNSLRELEEYSREVGENISHETFGRHYRNNHDEEYREKIIDDWIGGLFDFEKDVNRRVNQLEKILARKNDPEFEVLKDHLESSKLILQKMTDTWLEENIE